MPKPFFLGDDIQRQGSEVLNVRILAAVHLAGVYSLDIPFALITDIYSMAFITLYVEITQGILLVILAERAS